MMDKYLFFKMLLIGILTMHIEKNIPRIFFLFLGKKNPKSVGTNTCLKFSGIAGYHILAKEKRGESLLSSPVIAFFISRAAITLNVIPLPPNPRAKKLLGNFS